jgi:hypothetical protein
MPSIEKLIEYTNELISCLSDKYPKTVKESLAITRARFWIDTYRKEQRDAAAAAIPARLLTPATEEGEEEFRRWVYGDHRNGFSAHRENMRERYERGEKIQFVPKLVTTEEDGVSEGKGKPNKSTSEGGRRRTKKHKSSRKGKRCLSGK